MLRGRARVLLFLPTDDGLDPCELHELMDPFVVNRFIHVSPELNGVPSVTVDTAYFLMEGTISICSCHVVDRPFVIAFAPSLTD